MTIVSQSLALMTAIASLLVVVFHMRGSSKGEAVSAEVAKVTSDVEKALPDGPMAAIGVVMKDLEEELVKLAPDSKAVQMLERLKLVLSGAGALMLEAAKEGAK